MTSMKIVDYITYRLRNPAAAERLVDDVEAAILERLPCAESFEPFHSATRTSIPILSHPGAELHRFLCGDWKHYGSTTDLV